MVPSTLRPPKQRAQRLVVASLHWLQIPVEVLAIAGGDEAVVASRDVCDDGCKNVCLRKIQEHACRAAACALQAAIAVCLSFASSLHFTSLKGKEQLGKFSSSSTAQFSRCRLSETCRMVEL